MSSARPLLGALSLVLAACAPPAKPRVVPIAANGWSYAVTAGEGARELTVEATLARGSSSELSVEDGAEPYVSAVEADEGTGFHSVSRTGTSWIVPGCATNGCRLRYRFALADAARALGDVDRALAIGDAWLAPPSTWLLRPLHPEGRAPFRLTVTTPPGVAFVSGLARDAGGAFVADVSDVAEAPYSGFGKLRLRRLELGGGTVEIALAPGELGRSDDDVVHWIEEATRDVVGFYGRLPLARVLVIVTPVEGHGAMGKTLGNGGAAIVMTLGVLSTRHELDDDWVMTHELIHTAFPNLPRSQSWLEEGLSTYVEPIARARRGRLTSARVWTDFAQGMPQGQPEAGDRGLDHTPTWGRTYWGGAIFCLLADVEIRKATGGRRALDDALRAIVGHDGNIASRWPLAEALRVGDEATGTTVLRDLHARLGARAETIDLDRLFRELGVTPRGARAAFDDRAPLAPIRNAITAP